MLDVRCRFLNISAFIPGRTLRCLPLIFLDTFFGFAASFGTCGYNHDPYQCCYVNVEDRRRLTSAFARSRNLNGNRRML